jgi:hypothetical protein
MPDGKATARRQEANIIADLEHTQKESYLVPLFVRYVYVKTDSSSFIRRIFWCWESGCFYGTSAYLT